MLKKFFMIVAGVFMISCSVFADEKIPENWYQLGSYEYNAPDKVLMHFKGNVGYTKKSGNQEQDKILGSVSAKIRMNHIGFEASYMVDKDDRTNYNEKGVIADSTYNHTNQSRLALSYDLNKDFFASVGYENGRNTPFEIYNQTTQYAGFGYRVLKSAGHRLGVFAAYGNEDISFGTYPILPSGKTDGAYFQLNYLWFIAPTVAIKADYSYLRANMDNRDTGTLVVATKIGMTKSFSLVFSYTNEYIEAQKTVHRFTNDETIFTSIQFDISSTKFDFLGL